MLAGEIDVFGLFFFVVTLVVAYLSYLFVG